jgi:hypothetical protein
MYVPMKTSENRVGETDRRHICEGDTIRNRGYGRQPLTEENTAEVCTRKCYKNKQLTGT